MQTQGFTLAVLHKSLGLRKSQWIPVKIVESHDFRWGKIRANLAVKMCKTTESMLAVGRASTLSMTHIL